MIRIDITAEDRAAIAPIIPDLRRARDNALAAGLDPVTTLALQYDLPVEVARRCNDLLATDDL